MKLYINGLTIEGTHSEMADFAELWVMRQRTIDAMTPQKSTDTFEVTCKTLNASEVDAVIKAGAAHIQLTPDVKRHIKSVEKRYAHTPPVKHTDVVPADAPVTVVPTGVSGKKGRAASNGMTSRIRFAIFNGKTTRAALMKALNVDHNSLHNVFYSLVKSGHVEPVVVKKGRLTQDDAYRLTEVGLSYIEGDKKKLIEMGILKA